MLTYRWIEPDASGRFQPTDAGHGHVAATLPVTDRLGATVDSVAWLPARPGAWWTARGLEIVLGMPAIYDAEWSGAPLRLMATPDAWHLAHWPPQVSDTPNTDRLIRGDAPPVVRLCGAVILDWSRPGEIFDALCGVSRVVCDTEALGKRLVAALKDATRPRFRVAVARAQAPGQQPGKPQPVRQRAA